MSRIEELIQRHCPDGVEYKRLDELFNVRGGYTPSKKNPEYWVNGTVPWFRMEDIRENGRVLSSALQYVNKSAIKKAGLFPAGSIIVSTSATVGEHALLAVDGLANQRFVCLELKSQFKSKLLPKFLFYYCFRLDAYCLEHLTQSSFASVHMPSFNKFEFPIPPIEVQEEIVLILDAMCELEAKLQEELETREKQFAYCRSKLLSFTEKETPLLSLGEAARIGRGDYITKKDVTAGPIPVVLGGTEPAYYHSQFNHEGEAIVISRSGANAGFVSYWNQPIFISDGFVLDALECITARFFFHSLKNRQAELIGMKRGSGVPHINGKMLNELMIFVPPIETQREIVAKLDAFEALIKNLRGEIDARRKQYEHYRDTLLTFEKKGA